ncbi:protein kinaselike domain protein [Fusarium sporotrichioides]|uniref:Protein kinaselike domain protein n=1 Tax=Fusarium sporotrichioides TaxID=5514 RepID=A0A395RJV9_FUSSP|nr:protein kinaselike domain protein [Fusarium sporotrichioides]
MEVFSHSDTLEDADSPLIPQYQAGDSLKLQIVNADSHVLPCTNTIIVDIENVITATMAPVMLVTIDTPRPTRAILKLYDRRFGSSLREDDRGKHVPCRLYLETEFHSFNEGPDGQAKYEAALWYHSQEYFNTELKAYNHLKDLQGIIIPRLYASVKLSPTGCPPTSGAHDIYCSVYSIIIEFIPRGTLWDLPKDGVYEINKRGIVLEDSGPRNVMVHPSTRTPYIIDLAQCTIKDDVFKVWEEFDLVEEGSTLERDWCEHARSTDNPASIDVVMRIMLEKTFGFTIDIEYPDCSKVLDDTKTVSETTSSFVSLPTSFPDRPDESV